MGTMGTLAKVFFASGIGVLVGAYAEPLITPHLPASVQQPWMAKAIHGTIAAGATTIIFWAITGEAKKV